MNSVKNLYISYIEILLLFIFRFLELLCKLKKRMLVEI